MKKSFVFSVLLSMSLICSSQADFKEGFVLMHSGDTLNGLINYRGGSRSYNSCLFKQSKKQEVISYTHNDIAGFGFPDDRLFVSKKVDLSTGNSLDVFIEVLVRGEVSLYHYNGTFFIQKGESPLYELTIVKKEILQDGQKVNILLKNYLGVLSMVLTDCEKASSIIPNITLSETSLTRLVEVYNSCVNSPSVTILSGKPKIKFSIGLSAGLVNSNLDIFSRIRSDQVSFVDEQYEQSNSFQSGISLNFIFPRFSERLSFLGEVVYFKSQFFSFKRIDYSYAIDNNNVTIGMDQLYIPVGLRYTLSVNKISPYLNLGFFNTVNLKTTNLLKREIELLFGDYPTIIDEGPALKEINNQHGFWAGAGVMLPITKRIAGFVDLRSDFSYGLSDLPDVSTINNLRISFGLKIQ
jgi:hypothetical protein